MYISKANGKQRPLGIPVIADRCLQALTVNALEPEWEARFEPRTYGFRPGRGCQDAISAIYWTVHGNAKRTWVLDADLAAAFDHLDHDHIVASLGTFPARELVTRWLRAGVVERGWFTPTERGTPQGGPASPVLLNVALHGMEDAAGVRYRVNGPQGLQTEPDSPVLIKYADDLVALCHSREQAEQVKASLAAWLTPRGLTFNEDKTRITRLGDGFDFLGFNVRRYRNGKLLIKPSTAALRRIRERLTAEMLALRGANAQAVIQRLNPIIRGWSAYYRGMVSSQAFAALDSHVWRLVHKWATYSHPNKPKHWIIARYFGAFNKSRRDRWVFGDRDSGAYLVKFAWTKIVRHQMVKGGASPDDPALAEYWTRRRGRATPPLDAVSLRLLRAQHGRCPICGDFLLHADHQPQTPHDWEQWLKVIRKAARRQAITADAGPGTPDEPVALRLLHAYCARRRVDNHSGP